MTLIHISYLLAPVFFLNLNGKNLSYIFITFNIKLSSPSSALSGILGPKHFTPFIFFCLPPYLCTLSPFCDSFLYFIFFFVIFLICSSSKINFTNGSCTLKNCSSQPMADGRSASCLVSYNDQNFGYLVRKKKKEKNPKQPPSFLFWLFLSSVKFKTPSTRLQSNYLKLLFLAPLFFSGKSMTESLMVKFWVALCSF